MTDLRKAAEMALEVLLKYRSDDAIQQYAGIQDSITFLRQALAQPERNCDNCESLRRAAWDRINELETKLGEREWVGLTDEEIQDAMDYWSDDEHSDFGGAYQADSEYFNVRESWRYIESKLKEKNA